MEPVLDIRGLGDAEARELLARRLHDERPCGELLCIAEGGEASHPWKGLRVGGAGIAWRPLIAEPDLLLLTLRRGPCRTVAEPSVLGFMQADHARIHTMLAALAEAAERRGLDEASTLCGLLHGLLQRHMEVEESLLMPILAARHGQPRGPASVLRSEHLHIGAEMEDLRELTAEGGDLDEAARRARELGALLAEHAAREEEIVYALADRSLDDEERASLLDFCRALA